MDEARIGRALSLTACVLLAACNVPNTNGQPEPTSVPTALIAPTAALASLAPATPPATPSAVPPTATTTATTAASSSVSPSVTAPVATTAAPFAVYQIVGPVSDADQADIAFGITNGQRYLASRFSPVRGPVSVTITTDLRSSAGQAIGSTIVFSVTHPDWSNPPIGSTLSADHKKTAAHELAHVWQYQAGCLPNLPLANLPPIWLTEGVAEYVGYRVLIEAGLVGADYDTTLLARVRSNPNRFALQVAETTTPPGSFDSYAVFQLAIVRLVATHGGVGTLGTFCQVFAAGSDWRTAFQRAFGVDVATFYAEFDPYRIG